MTEDFTGKKILITGAGGFIGSHLARWFSGVDCSLALTERVNPERPAPAAKADVTWHGCDTSSPAFREMMVAGDFDYIFHFAGNANVNVSVERPAFDFQQNCVATVEMLEALRQSGSGAVFVYASSAAVYGNPVRLPISEADLTVPISPYGVSKLAAERYVTAYCQLYGLKGVSLRMFSPFGPGLRKQIVFDLTRKILGGGALKVFGDGSQTRDFIHVDDLVSAILCVTRSDSHRGGVYNIGSGVATPTSEIATLLVEIAGKDIEIQYSQTQVAGNPDKWRADISKLLALGWTPTVALRDGLAETVKWIAHEYP